MLKTSAIVFFVGVFFRFASLTFYFGGDILKKEVGKRKNLSFVHKALSFSDLRKGGEVV